MSTWLSKSLSNEFKFSADYHYTKYKCYTNVLHAALFHPLSSTVSTQKVAQSSRIAVIQYDYFQAFC
jgi:hypothetical protein